MNRRCFLKIAGASAALGILNPKGFANAEAPACSMSPPYTKKELLNIYDRELPNYTASLKKSMAENQVIDYAANAGVEFGNLMKEIPYVGCLDYPLPQTLVGSAVSLSFYRVMQAKGLKVTDAGALIVDAFKEGQKKYSEKELHDQGEQMFTGQFYQIQAYAAQKSQEKKYRDDWVFKFISGSPGSNFDWGWDFTECGVQKFLKAQGAIELLPYICSLDLLLSKLQQTGMERKTTLYNGTVCDFRFKKGR